MWRKLVGLFSRSATADEDAHELTITFHGTERQQTLARLSKQHLEALLDSVGREGLSDFDSLEQFLDQEMDAIEELLEEHGIEAGFDTTSMDNFPIIQGFSVSLAGKTILENDSYFCFMEKGLDKKGSPKKNYGLRPEKGTVIFASEMIGDAIFTFSIAAAMFDQNLLSLDKKSFYNTRYDGKALELIESDNSCNESEHFAVYNRGEFAALARKYWRR